MCPRLKSVECLSIPQHEWTYMEPLPVQPSRIEAFTIFGQILCFILESSLSDNEFYPSCVTFWYVYNPSTNKWTEVTQRIDPSISQTFEKCLQDGGSIIFSSESSVLFAISQEVSSRFSVTFSVNTDRDDDVCIIKSGDLAPIHSDGTYKLSGHSLVICRNQLYCLGGQLSGLGNDNHVRINVSRLSEDHTDWIPMAGMGAPRTDFAAVDIGEHFLHLTWLHT